MVVVLFRRDDCLIVEPALNRLQSDVLDSSVPLSSSLLETLNVEQLSVAVNKMDISKLNWRQAEESQSPHHTLQN
jgi:sulfate adenylyltransferase subunit 1 (EFTu-like GTPase family)